MSGAFGTATPTRIFRKKEIIDAEKDEMWRAQQEVLKARREGRALSGVEERRARVKREAQEKEEKRQRDRDLLAKGIKPPQEKYIPYGEEDEGLKGGFLIPLAPFGIPKYDNGERFDLKAPYTDQGWVDENDEGPFGWVKNIFGGKKDSK